MDQEQYMKTLQSLEIQKRYIQSYRAQLDALELQISELNSARDTIKSYSELDTGDEILVPVGGNFFVLGNIADPKNALSNLGAGITAKESVGKALERLDGRLKNLNSARAKLGQELRSIELQYRALSKKFEADYAQMMEQQQAPGLVQNQASGENQE